MKALIKDNLVVQIGPKAFPIHPELTWVDCDDNCRAGWSYIDLVLSPPPVIIEPAIVKSELELKIEALWDSLANQDDTKLNELKARLVI